MRVKGFYCIKEVSSFDIRNSLFDILRFAVLMKPAIPWVSLAVHLRLFIYGFSIVT